MLNLDATLLIQLVNFSLLMLALHHLVFRPLLRCREERRDWREQLEEGAFQLREEAARLADFYRSEREELDRQIAEIWRERREEAARRERQLLEEAQSKALQELAVRKHRLEEERERAEGFLEEAARRISGEMVRRLLAREA